MSSSAGQFSELMNHAFKYSHLSIIIQVLRYRLPGLRPQNHILSQFVFPKTVGITLFFGR